MDEVRTTVERERRALVARLRAVDDGDWARPTACAGWTVHHVLAHLVTPFVVPAPAMALRVLRRGGVGLAMDAVARDLVVRHPPQELLDLLEAHAASPFRPPGLPASAPLADVVAHSADVRLALGDPLQDWDDPARLRPALDFLVSPRAALGFVPPGRLRGLALEAEDTDWRHGRGRPVRGTGLALALAVLGRPDGLRAVGLPAPEGVPV